MDRSLTVKGTKAKVAIAWNALDGERAVAYINLAAHEVGLKIVYYGPAGSGKDTNVRKLHDMAPPESRSELVSVGGPPAILCFHFSPLYPAEIAGMKIKLELYTVPGPVIYKVKRKLILMGADGVVFVADSNPDMRDDNINMLEDLSDNLQKCALNPSDVPLVFQFNKRDLPDAMPIDMMNADLNPSKLPVCEAVADKGKGVGPTAAEVSNLAIRKFIRGQGRGDGGKKHVPGGTPKGLRGT